MSQQTEREKSERKRERDGDRQRTQRGRERLQTRERERKGKRRGDRQGGGKESERLRETEAREMYLHIRICIYTATYCIMLHCNATHTGDQPTSLYVICHQKTSVLLHIESTSRQTKVFIYWAYKPTQHANKETQPVPRFFWVFSL